MSTQRGFYYKPHLSVYTAFSNQHTPAWILQGSFGIHYLVRELLSMQSVKAGAQTVDLLMAYSAYNSSVLAEIELRRKIRQILKI